jgi:hypothetical protein
MASQRWGLPFPGAEIAAEAERAGAEVDTLRRELDGALDELETAARVA